MGVRVCAWKRMSDDGAGRQGHVRVCIANERRNFAFDEILMSYGGKSSL